jgi:hypothetical protein
MRRLRYLFAVAAPRKTRARARTHARGPRVAAYLHPCVGRAARIMCLETGREAILPLIARRKSAPNEKASASARAPVECQLRDI